MDRPRGWWRLVMSIALLAAGACAVAPAAPPPTPTLVVVSLPSAYTTTAGAQMALWATRDGGYFDQEGLDVSLTYIGNGQTMISGLLSGSILFSASGAQQIVDADLNGANIVMIAGYVDRIAGSIYVGPDITSADQLRGKVIGVTALNSASDTAAQLGLRYLGLDGQVDRVSTGGPAQTLAAMLSRGIAGGLLAPPETVTARKQGFHELLNIASVPNATSVSGIVTTRQWASDHPDLTQRYVSAFLKRMHRVITDKPFGIQVLAHYTNNSDQDALNETYDYYQNLLRKDASVSLPGVQAALDFAANTNARALTSHPADFVDLTYLNALKTNGAVRQLWGTDTP